MRRFPLLVALVALTACTMPRQYPEIPEVLPPAPVSTPPPPVQSPPEPVLEISWPAHPVFMAPAPEPEVLPKSRRNVPVRTVSLPPERLIQEAQQAARVVPTKEGFWGASGTQRYIWIPGKIYDVYLAPGMGTKLTLPPGETLAHALILNPKSFDVSTATVGSEGAVSSIILIRPCAPVEDACVRSPDVDVAVTSASGRGYNLHLIIGRISMVEATWEITPIPHLEVTEPGMPLRRQP